MHFDGRQRLAVTVFGAGVIIPIIARLIDGPETALRALPFAALTVLIGGALWFFSQRET